MEQNTVIYESANYIHHRSVDSRFMLSGVQCCYCRITFSKNKSNSVCIRFDIMEISGLRRPRDTDHASDFPRMRSDGYFWIGLVVMNDIV